MPHAADFRLRHEGMDLIETNGRGFGDRRDVTVGSSEDLLRPDMADDTDAHRRAQQSGTQGVSRQDGRLARGYSPA